MNSDSVWGVQRPKKASQKRGFEVGFPSKGKPGGVGELVQLKGSAEVWKLKVNVFGKGREP